VTGGFLWIRRTSMSSCMYHVGIVQCISMWHVPRSSLICRDHFKIVETQMSLECLSRLAIFSRDSTLVCGLTARVLLVSVLVVVPRRSRRAAPAPRLGARALLATWSCCCSLEATHCTTRFWLVLHSVHARAVLSFSFMSRY
jgi:hypothetical protein